jgi:hypothetical protein
MKWVMRVAHKGEKISGYRVLVELKEGNNLEDLGKDGRIMLT